MNKRIIPGSLSLILILIFGLNISLASAEQVYRIENYIVEMEVNNDGDFIVTEEIEWEYSASSGGATGGGAGGGGGGAG